MVHYVLCLLRSEAEMHFRSSFMAMFIVWGKVPLLFAKQKLRIPTRSKIIDREIQN